MVDTGAEKTIISKKVFSKIDGQPKLVQKGCLLHAGGDPLKDYGKCTLSIQLDDATFMKEVIIADIQDDALLGIDIMRNKDGKIADILMSKNKIVIDGVEISCFQPKARSTRRVRLADDYEISGHTEQILDVFVERYEEDDLIQNYEVIIQPTVSFMEKYPLMLANCLVNINSTPTVKVRVMNPFSKSVRLRQDTVIGTAEETSSDNILQIILNSEDPKENENFSAVKRINLCNDVQNHRDMPFSREVREKSDSVDTSDLKVPSHLDELFQKSTKGKNRNEKYAIAKLLTNYQDVFSKNEEDIGLTRLTEHCIDTQGAKPIKQPFRRTPLAFVNEEKAVIDKLKKKKQGVIRDSNSPWASPILLIRKKDNSVRPVVDYRALNKLCQVDAFPIPKVDDCLDSLSGAKLFSTVDMTSGYFQVPVKASDIPKTAFITKQGLFEFTSMPQGLTNSSATFQRVMQLALNGLQ